MVAISRQSLILPSLPPPQSLIDNGYSTNIHSTNRNASNHGRSTSRCCIPITVSMARQHPRLRPSHHCLPDHTIRHPLQRPHSQLSLRNPLDNFNVLSRLVHLPHSPTTTNTSPNHPLHAQECHLPRRSTLHVALTLPHDYQAHHLHRGHAVELRNRGSDWRATAGDQAMAK